MQAVQAAARGALENPHLTGEAEMRDGGKGPARPGGAMAGSQEAGQPHSTGFDMGAAVPVAEPEWSAAYRGLCLYLARALAPAWERPIAVPAAPGSKLLHAGLSDATLLVKTSISNLILLPD